MRAPRPRRGAPATRRAAGAALAALVCASPPAGAQIWSARHDGPLAGNDEPAAIASGPGGEIYVTGRSAGSRGYDILTVKYAPDGRELWAARYDGPAGRDDEGVGVALGPGGALYVAGTSDGGPSTSLDYVLARYDAATGERRWLLRIDGRETGACPEPPCPPGVDRLAALTLTGGGSGAPLVAAVTGESAGRGGADFLTVLVGAEGRIRGFARFDGPAGSTDQAAAIAAAPGGGVVVAGRTRGRGGFDLVTVAYDAAARPRWTATYDGPAHGYDGAVAVAVDPSGATLVLGTSYSAWNRTGIVVAEYAPDGARRWVARPEADPELSANAAALALDPSGAGVLIAGTTGRGRNWDFLTARLDRRGRVRWLALHDGWSRATDRATAIAVDADGDVYVTGASDVSGVWPCLVCPAFLTVKHSGRDGTTLWSERFEGAIRGEHRPAALALVGDGVVVTGMAAGGGRGGLDLGEGPRDYVTVRYPGRRPGSLR